MATTARILNAPAILSETNLDLQGKIWRHNIENYLIINYDQTPLPFVVTGNYTVNEKGAKSVPLQNKGKKKQITGTFAVPVSLTGELFSPHSLYIRVPRCLPK